MLGGFLNSFLSQSSQTWLWFRIILWKILGPEPRLSLVIFETLRLQSWLIAGHGWVDFTVSDLAQKLIGTNLGQFFVQLRIYWKVVINKIKEKFLRIYKNGLNDFQAIIP